MKFIYPKLLKENKDFILENLKLAKQLLTSGKLDNADFDELVKNDPTPTKKFVGWMAKIWIAEHPQMDELAKKIEEYFNFLEKGKAPTKDINQFKSFKALQDEVDTLNKTGAGKSAKDLESDYDVIEDNENVLILAPHTHEASRKLGLSVFAFRDCGGGGKDSAWCVTYKAPDHWNDYYYSRGLTFYYVKVKSPELIERIKKEISKDYQKYTVVAITVSEDGSKIECWNGTDQSMGTNTKQVKTFLNIIGMD